MVVVRGDLTRRSTFLALLLLAPSGLFVGGTTQVSERGSPRDRAPLSPAQALASFELEAGYRIEVAAAEPLIRNPVAIAFDHRGRMEVVNKRWRGKSGTIVNCENTGISEMELANSEDPKHITQVLDAYNKQFKLAKEKLAR